MKSLGAKAASQNAPKSKDFNPNFLGQTKVVPVILGLAAAAGSLSQAQAQAQAQAQTVPTSPGPGSGVVAWQSIAANARTYALVQFQSGVTQNEAVVLASRCRFRGSTGYLAEFGSDSPAEWQNVRSRFGNSLGGQRVENIWVNAREEYDGYVRWAQNRTSVRNIRIWNAWAPNEPQAKTAVTLHALYPGLFNSCSAQDRYTRMLVEFR